MPKSSGSRDWASEHAESRSGRGQHGQFVEAAAGDEPAEEFLVGGAAGLVLVRGDVGGQQGAERVGAFGQVLPDRGGQQGDAERTASRQPVRGVRELWRYGGRARGSGTEATGRGVHDVQGVVGGQRRQRDEQGARGR